MKPERTISESEWKSAAAKTAEAVANSIPEHADLPQPSDTLNARMETFLQEQTEKRRSLRPLQLVAAVLAVILLLGALLIAVSPTVRAAVLSWTRTVFSDGVRYEFHEASAAPDFARYGLTELPQGFFETERTGSGAYGQVTYSGPEGMLVLIWLPMQDHNQVQIETQVQEPPVESLTVQGCHAEYVDGVLLWFDEERGLVFLLSGSQDRASLIDLAESCSKIQ